MVKNYNNFSFERNSSVHLARVGMQTPTNIKLYTSNHSNNPMYWTSSTHKTNMVAPAMKHLMRHEQEHGQFSGDDDNYLMDLQVLNINQRDFKTHW